MDASILWFTAGYVEYKTPNFLTPDDTLEQIDISMEISSDFLFRMMFGRPISHSP